MIALTDKNNSVKYGDNVKLQDVHVLLHID